MILAWLCRFELKTKPYEAGQIRIQNVNTKLPNLHRLHIVG